MRHRQRSTTIPSITNIGTLYFRQQGLPQNPWVVNAEYNNYPQFVAYPNPLVEHCYDTLHSGPPYTTGGPFDKWLFNNNAPVPQGWGTHYEAPTETGCWWKYVGGWIITRNALVDSVFGGYPGYKTPGAPSGPNNDGSHTWGDGSSYGATAWKRFQPGRNKADLAVFLGEIRDVPRMLRTTAKGFAEAYKLRFGRNPRGKMRKAADHWLNTQFGWLPFISDLRKFYTAYRAADRLIEQVRRDNGLWVKRGGVVKETKENENVYEKTHTARSDLSIHPAIPYDTFVNLPNVGRTTASIVYAQRVWFEARFRYWIPDVESVEWSQAATRQLFGGSINAALIWELTPWSWLIDWCTNMGDVISNISGPSMVENLAAKYAYLMTTTELQLRINTFLNLKSGSRNLTQSFLLQRKQRVEANPFGFNVTWDGLSPRQWSILGALGVTRMH